MNPFERQFTLNDVTIQHPFAKHERVLNKELFLYSTIIPLVTIIVTGLPLTTPSKYRLYNTFVGVVGVALSISITTLTTNFLKNYIGRLRPDFLARCQPKDGTPLDILVLAKDVCTTKDRANLLEGFRTTPSGHSSMSFAGLFYLTLWISGQLAAGDWVVGSWRTVIAWIPTLGATLIALTRTQDYRHHFVDVTLGSLLGLGIAYWSYFRLFPRLNHERSQCCLMVIQEIKEQEEQVQHMRLDVPTAENHSMTSASSYSALNPV